MLHKYFIVVIYFPIFVVSTLLPLRVGSPVLANASPSRPRAMERKVANTGVAVASIDNYDGIVVQDNFRSNGGRLAGAVPSKTMAITSVLAAAGPQETGGKVEKSRIAVTSINNEDGLLVDHYKQYDGNGTIEEGWPEKEDWISFTDMFNSSKYILERSCRQFKQELNSEDEIADLYDAIQSVAEDTLIDHRFILAVVVQESGGCVRAPTSDYGVPNPGLMQDHNGTASCNSDGDVQTPCPTDMIKQMITEGSGGTVWGDGLAQCINKADGDDVSAFYQAARIYNSGSIDDSGDLGEGIATHCYASDIANRLTGWVKNKHRCELDD